MFRLSTLLFCHVSGAVVWNIVSLCKGLYKVIVRCFMYFSALMACVRLCYFAFTDCVIIIVVGLFALHCYSAIRLSS